MIDNFKDIISQLKELSTVVNSFKSEAVQIRLIELVFSAQKTDEPDDETSDGNADAATPARRGKKRRKSPARRGADNSGAASSEGKPAAKSGNRAPRTGRVGGKAQLATLIASGFFKNPKTIGKIVEHCEVNKALQYKQSDFSGPLGRAVRDGTLKRQKNADKQYEYVNS